MITYFNEQGINRLFAGSLLVFAIASLVLLRYGISIPAIIILLLPGAVVALLYNYAKTHFTDYLYYLVLDGLMMLSAVLMLFIRI